MEGEEREEIPWSSLVAQVDENTDKRWYIVAGIVAALVFAVAAIRFVGVTGQGGQPIPQAIIPDTTSTAASQETQATLVVAEDELTARSDEGPNTDVEARAEWFVTDFFTLDGSSETIRSIRQALSADLTDVVLPHEAGDGSEGRFVEWARVIALHDDGDEMFRVEVAYRSIVGTESGFERMPVEFVSLTIDRSNAIPVVTSLPVRSQPWAVAGGHDGTDVGG
jgi:hypothetical protein